MRLLSGCVVVAFALFLAGLAMTAYLRPAHAKRFFNAFAASARTHYTEQALRLVVGSALVVFSSAMWQPDLFRLFGWVMVVTTVGLLVIPWRWHQQLARRIVPPVLEHMKLLGAGALLMAALLLYGVVAGDAA
jgi:cell division protein FtsW (lipid II flippase)